MFDYILVKKVRWGLLPPLCSAATASPRLHRPMQTPNDCSGEPVCINGKCNRDVGTTICKGGTPSPTPPNNCKPTGTLTCEGKTHTTYKCSLQGTAATSALLNLNDNSEGGDRGRREVPPQHTGWSNGWSRCGKMIRITASNGRSVMAKMVDECDSMNGCDKEHAGQPPYRYSIADGSAVAWNGLGLNQSDGVVKVTWFMA